MHKSSINFLIYLIIVRPDLIYNQQIIDEEKILEELNRMEDTLIRFTVIEENLKSQMLIRNQLVKFLKYYRLEFEQLNIAIKCNKLKKQYKIIKIIYEGLCKQMPNMKEHYGEFIKTKNDIIYFEKGEISRKHFFKFLPFNEAYGQEHTLTLSPIFSFYDPSLDVEKKQNNQSFIKFFLQRMQEIITDVYSLIISSYEMFIILNLLFYL